MKLRPASANPAYEDFYRGNIGILWELLIRGKREFEHFAAACPCGTAWGWTPDLEQAKRIRDAMKKLGCLRCRKGKR